MYVYPALAKLSYQIDLRPGMVEAVRPEDPERTDDSSTQLNPVVDQQSSHLQVIATQVAPMQQPSQEAIETKLTQGATQPQLPQKSTGHFQQTATIPNLPQESEAQLLPQDEAAEQLHPDTNSTLPESQAAQETLQEEIPKETKV